MSFDNQDDDNQEPGQDNMRPVKMSGGNAYEYADSQSPPWLVIKRPNDGTDPRAWSNLVEFWYYDQDTDQYRLGFYLNDKGLARVRGVTPSDVPARVMAHPNQKDHAALFEVTGDDNTDKLVQVLTHEAKFNLPVTVPYLVNHNAERLYWGSNDPATHDAYDQHRPHTGDQYLRPATSPGQAPTVHYYRADGGWQPPLPEDPDTPNPQDQDQGRGEAVQATVAAGAGGAATPLGLDGPPKVSLSKVREAARKDPARPQGGRTPGAAADVYYVEVALWREGLLSSRWMGDASFGSKTVEAYSAWQRQLGYRGADADGIPGRTSLTKLGKRHVFSRFTVID